MAKFCGKCGAKLDEKTSLCPNCNADELKKLQKQLEVSSESNITDQPTLIKTQISKRAAKKAAKEAKKTQKKADKKATKKAKQAAMTIRQRVRRFFLKLIAVLFLLTILGAGVASLLVYLDFVNISIISSLFNKFGIKNEPVDSGGSLYTPDEDAISLDDDTGVVYINNVIIIFFNEGTSQQEIEATIKSIDGTVVGSLPIIDQYQVQIASRSLQELIKICDEIKELECVYDAIYDAAFEIQSDAIPNDPWTKTWFSSGETWSVQNPSGANWWLEAVNAIDAWDDNSDFSNIKIGIVDNGFDSGHEDLKKVIAYTSPINNKAEHGTHVAGIIGAEANNGKGITGLVWNCELYTYDWELSTSQKVVDNLFDMQWSTFNQILGGTVKLVEQGAKVINFSVGQTGSMNGTTRTDEEVNCNGYYASLYLHALLERGYDFLIVQSAGNGNANNVSVDAVYNGLYCSINSDNCVTSENVGYEDIVGRVVVVGAAQNDGNNTYSQTYWSNAGSRVDICAPGKDVYSTVPGKLFGSYSYLSGTSMAAPVVTGVAALAWSVNPNLSGSDIKNIICAEQNTQFIVSDNTSKEHPLTDIYRMINAKLSVDAARNYSPEIKDVHGSFDESSVPDGAGEFNGHYYYVYDIDTIKDWNEAQEYCEAQGGYLATITSAEEDSFLYAYMVSRGYHSAMFGLTNHDTTNVWIWTTGETYAYENWRSGEPNHQDGYEHYGMYYNRNTDGSWNDGSGAGGPFICEWGEYKIDYTLSESTKATSEERDIVLVLDVSGSMSGTPMEETKKAATNFVNTILGEDANIGIVTYDDTAKVASDFLTQVDPLRNIISHISSGGNTNIEVGLCTAYHMLQNSSSKKKIIVLMSDGEPNRGKEGNELVSYADEIKNSGVIIYTLGFFESMSYGKSSAQTLMERIASDGCHYEVANADDLIFFFNDIADTINGQRYIYVRIACPVDVTVSYNGEILTSVEDELNTRTAFGTLSFEENPDSDTYDDDRIKVLRLKEGVDYDIQIVGNGHGIMDYTIGFMDEDGEYNDFREFEDIKITKRTVIDTVASASQDTVLQVDQDGDGKYDVIYKAGANEHGEEVVRNVTLLYVSIGCLVGVVLLILILVVRSKVINKK